MKKIISFIVALSIVFSSFCLVAADEQKLPFSASIEYDGKRAIVTISTTAFETIDIGVISTAECSKIKYSNDFVMDVKCGIDITYADALNKRATDNAGNVFAVVQGVGYKFIDDNVSAPIPYEGPAYEFVYDNVEEGTVFTVVANTVKAIEKDGSVWNATNIEELTAEVSQVSANISYNGSRAVITISTTEFKEIDVAVISDIECSKVSRTNDFMSNVILEGDIVFSDVMNKKAVDDLGNAYAIATGAGYLYSGGEDALIPYEGSTYEFVYENVEEGTVFTVVSDTAKAIEKSGDVKSSTKICDLIAEAPPIVIGDVNMDGVIDALDALEILKYSAKLINLEGRALIAADVNKDGKITSADALAVLKHVAALEKIV